MRVVIESHEMSGTKRPAKQSPASARNHSPSSSDSTADPEETTSEVRTKLDLARQFLDMGDPESARHMLDEVLEEGDPVQKQEAQQLIETLP
jgi:pilus assembly protein FimV